mgnify:CR=1 FL=1
MAESASVQHDIAGNRFVVRLEGHEAVLRYRRAGQTIDMYQTVVPEAFRGRGIAEQLARAAFEFAKVERLAVIPSCSYLSGPYLKRHPEYQLLVSR